MALIITSGRIDAHNGKRPLVGRPKPRNEEKLRFERFFHLQNGYTEKIKRGNRPTREKMTWNAVGGRKKTHSQKRRIR